MANEHWIPSPSIPVQFIRIRSIVAVFVFHFIKTIQMSADLLSCGCGNCGGSGGVFHYWRWAGGGEHELHTKIVNGFSDIFHFNTCDIPKTQSLKRKKWGVISIHSKNLPGQNESKSKLCNFWVRMIWFFALQIHVWRVLPLPSHLLTDCIVYFAFYTKWVEKLQ